ncbi:hypothetical protein [Thomasclavelia cocleata]|uniref:Uncharacterized protein n=1 Tax=Thomasclavelia cocleata TaxID=69824 RepID=A0A1I0CP08_9FIRM|nr:hypothetical protein [Thomasclavelia cocleata]MCR1960756.1 hypothetical protein [Thomasclavelia cocleata]SET21229.1 hypothetical protein SAMN04489758_103145 [Thomasclavelia cocleata]
MSIDTCKEEAFKEFDSTFITLLEFKKDKDYEMMRFYGAQLLGKFKK